MLINPVDLLLWTFRRNENDVVKLYDALSPIMEVSTGGDMLNFGFWDETTLHPVDAQKRLCEMMGDMAQISSAEIIADIGSGILGPAKIWNSQYPSLQISSVNVNFSQLASVEPSNISKLNSTARMLPFSNSSLDRVIALESAQHFKPLDNFISESKRVLMKSGFLVMAVPITLKNSSNLIYILIMGFGMSLLMTLIITLINTGYDNEYFMRFLKAWSVGLPIAIIVSLLVGPIAKRFVDNISK